MSQNGQQQGQQGQQAPQGPAPNQGNQLAQALVQHERVKKSTELPLFYGRKDKDVVTAHNLLDRIKNAAAIAGWNAQRTSQEFYMILRDKAILWYNSLDNEGINTDEHDWEAIKAAFIAAYAPRYTAKTTCNVFVELQQKTGESVQDYYLRVNEAFKRLCEAKPESITTEVQAELLPQLALNEALVYKLEGVRQEEKYFLNQLFTAGLREDLRTKIMEKGEDNIKDTLDAARELEVILADKRSRAVHVSNVGEQDQDREQDEDDEHVEAIQGNKFSGSSGKTRPGGNTSPKFQGTCRYCKKYGHSQRYCRARIQNRAPMRDQQGKPFTRNQVQQIQDDTHPLDLASLQVNSLNF